eukprot:Platyproteum_vivax@DN5164_c0_g2_i1.p1
MRLLEAMDEKYYRSYEKGKYPEIRGAFMKGDERDLGNDSYFGGRVTKLSKVFEPLEYNLGDEANDQQISVEWTVGLADDGEKFFYEDQKNKNTPVSDLIKAVVKKDFLENWDCQPEGDRSHNLHIQGLPRLRKG